MLTIRFQRTGKQNSPFYRIVLTDKKSAVKSNALKILGYYNPVTKESKISKDQILELVSKGAKPSNSMAKFLIENKIKHKNIIYIPDAKKAPKTKEEKQEKKESRSEAKRPSEATNTTDKKPREEKNGSAATQEPEKTPEAIANEQKSAMPKTADQQEEKPKDKKENQ